MDQEIKALRLELTSLKNHFNDKCHTIENRLNELAEKKAQVQEQTLTNNEKIQLTVKQLKLNSEYSPPKKSETKSKIQGKTQQPSILSAKISILLVFISTVLSSMFTWFSPLSNIYYSYKKRELLGIFYLTIVGVGLTLAGFGYLMQLLIDELGAGSKSLLMSIVTLLVTVLGVSLKLKSKFTEFANTIIALGILLSYSTVYFSGSVYGIIPSSVVIFLYLLIAMSCHILAIWLDAKLVSSLGVIGIASMPILSNTIQIQPVYYLLSLLFVTSSSLAIAYKKQAPWLANLSFIFTIAALEWTIGIETLNVPTIVIDLFYLVFLTFIAISLYKGKGESKGLLTLLAASIGSIILVFFQTHTAFKASMDVCFLLNAAFSLFISILFIKMRVKHSSIFVLTTALWLALAIVSLLSNAYWGIAWSIEGILLLCIGRKLYYSRVINQGQVLVTLSLLYSWFALAAHFPLPALMTLDGWVLSITILLVIGGWQRLINNTEQFDAFTQHKIKPFLQLLEVVWLTILVIFTLDLWLGNWTGVMVVLLQLVLMFRAKHCKHVAIEVFALLLILIPLFYTVIGMLLVESYRFTSLPMFAKVALASAFIQLWLWSEFYRKYQLNSALGKVVESARILFYLLLPVCWLGSAVRYLEANSLTILWLSPFIALLISTKIKHYLLALETKILTVLASIVLIFYLGQLALIDMVISVLGFTFFYGSAFYLVKKQLNTALYQLICSWGLISIGLAIPFAIGLQNNSLLAGVSALSVFWLSYLYFTPFYEHLQRNTTFIITVNIILLIMSWILTYLNVLYVIIPTVCLIVCIFNKTILVDSLRFKYFNRDNINLTLHTVLAITYLVLCSSLAKSNMDLLITPLLALHGAFIIFFQKNNTVSIKYSFTLITLGILKLALLDVTSALLWQKVILFMGVGVFILGLSYWYQKLTKSLV